MDSARIDLSAQPSHHRFEREVMVRFAHCDPAGMVFYPQYLVILNGLVEDWMRDALGFPYAELVQRDRIGLPSVSLACEFLAPSLLGDALILGLSVERLGRSSIQLALGARSGDCIRMRMRQSIVVTSLETHRPIELPDSMRARAERFLLASA